MDYRKVKAFFEMIGVDVEDVTGSIQMYEKTRGKKPKNILLSHPQIIIGDVRVCFSTTEEQTRKLMQESSETIILGSNHSNEFTKH